MSSVSPSSRSTRTRQFGSYVLGRRIGAGGMATVFAARQIGAVGATRVVAVKVMATALADDPAARRMFEREAVIATRIEHPNIVRTYEVGEVGGEIFLAMELVPGAALSTICARAGSAVPLAIAVRVACDVARGPPGRPRSVRRERRADGSRSSRRDSAQRRRGLRRDDEALRLRCCPDRRARRFARGEHSRQTSVSCPRADPPRENRLLTSWTSTALAPSSLSSSPGSARRTTNAARGARTVPRAEAGGAIRAQQSTSEPCARTSPRRSRTSSRRRSRLTRARVSKRRRKCGAPSPPRAMRAVWRPWRRTTSALGCAASRRRRGRSRSWSASWRRRRRTIRSSPPSRSSPPCRRGRSRAAPEPRRPPRVRRGGSRRQVACSRPSERRSARGPMRAIRQTLRAPLRAGSILASPGAGEPPLAAGVHLLVTLGSPDSGAWAHVAFDHITVSATSGSQLVVVCLTPRAEGQRALVVPSPSPTDPDPCADLHASGFAGVNGVFPPSTISDDWDLIPNPWELDFDGLSPGDALTVRASAVFGGAAAASEPRSESCVQNGQAKASSPPFRESPSRSPFRRRAKRGSRVPAHSGAMPNSIATKGKRSAPGSIRRRSQPSRAPLPPALEARGTSPSSRR